MTKSSNGCTSNESPDAAEKMVPGPTLRAPMHDLSQSLRRFSRDILEQTAFCKGKKSGALRLRSGALIVVTLGVEAAADCTGGGQHTRSEHNQRAGFRRG